MFKLSLTFCHDPYLCSNVQFIYHDLIMILECSQLGDACTPCWPQPRENMVGVNMILAWYPQNTRKWHHAHLCLLQPCLLQPCFHVAGDLTPPFWRQGALSRTPLVAKEPTKESVTGCQIVQLFINYYLYMVRTNIVCFMFVISCHRAKTYVYIYIYIYILFDNNNDNIDK